MRRTPVLNVIEVGLNGNPHTLRLGRTDPLGDTTSTLNPDGLEFTQLEETYHFGTRQHVHELVLRPVGSE